LYRTDFLTIDEVFWDDDCLFRDSPQDVTLGTLNSQSGTPSTRWSNSYKLINRAIGIIEGIEASKPKISDVKKNQYIGEAYCFLGFGYGQLVTYFGDCVLIKTKMNLNDSYNAVRSPKAEVMQFAYECFDKAAELLPTKFSDSQVRFTKGAAYGFKARFAMQVGDYNIAAEAAKKCMDLNEYQLHDNYQTLFQAYSSPELIFWFKGDLSVPYGVGPFARVSNYAPRTIGGTSNRGPSYQLFCSYLCIDGLPIDESPLYNPKDPFENRDPRMAYTCMPFKTKYSKDYDEYLQSRQDGTIEQKYPEYLWGGILEFSPNPYNTHQYDARVHGLVKTSDSKAANQHSVYTGLPLIKFVKPDWQYNSKYGNTSDNVYPYLRFAEVLMNYCEAKYELGTLTQADLDMTINKIRERAYAGTGIDYPKVSLSDNNLRRIIRMDRRVEFAFENMRYRDLLRWRLMEKTQNTPQYYLNRAWSGSANWNGQVGELSNCTLSDDFLRHLKNWDEGNYPIGGIPPIDEDGLPDLTEMESKGYDI
ncbi:MAG: RagB/SusD family nutrient uptake outer membrane protein, partial [Bacteroidales bacterium]|nr:RagB/SusD family nutrient uptake outer membrane protein [Bacteroidales bacterium]